MATYVSSGSFVSSFESKAKSCIWLTPRILFLCQMSPLLFHASANKPSAFYWQVMLAQYIWDSLYRAPRKPQNTPCFCHGNRLLSTNLWWNLIAENNTNIHTHTHTHTCTHTCTHTQKTFNTKIMLYGNCHMRPHVFVWLVRSWKMVMLEVVMRRLGNAVVWTADIDNLGIILESYQLIFVYN